MGYIYIIRNIINDKVYIGQTKKSIEHRWSDHYKSYKINDYLLYRAMRKHGIENFYVEEIERCENNSLNEREKYWINYYDSYYNGYNSTLGGEGTTKYEYEKIYNVYQQNKSIKDTAKIIGCSECTVTEVCHSYNIYPIEDIKRKINKIDITTLKIIETFDSLRLAALSTGKIENNRNIRAVCNGEQKTAYGFGWEYADFPIQNKNYKNKRYKIVCQYTIDTNEFIAEYESAAAAARALGGGSSQASTILKNCKGKTNTAYGYKWKYKE